MQMQLAHSFFSENTDLIVEHQLSGRVRFVEEVEVVQHRRVREHEVHDLMTKQSAQLSYDLNMLQKHVVKNLSAFKVENNI